MKKNLTYTLLRKPYRSVGIAVVLCFTLLGCFSKKNTAFNRGFNNMTSRWNAYFNANELITQARADFEANYSEDYDEILPVFKYGTDESVSVMYPAMDTAIKKCLQDINWHSLEEKGKEQIKWIDDCWMLVGKAEFYKRKFVKSDEIFDYVYVHYEDKETKLNARLYSIKSWLELGQFEKAAVELENIENRIESDAKILASMAKKDDKKKKTKMSSSNWKTQQKISKKAQKRSKAKAQAKEDKLKPLSQEFLIEFKATYADYYIRQENYERAIVKLNQATNLGPKKQIKARWYYILGQLYAAQGNKTEGIEYFTKAKEASNSYELDFHSFVSIILNSSRNKEELLDLRKELLKMTKDIKNDIYLDIIYYGLAEIEFKLNNPDQAEEYLKLSVAYTSGNVNQQIKTYLRLADFYFNDKNYVGAQEYYDLAVAILPEDYPNYYVIKNKTISLNQLVTDLNTITFQDSIQRVSKMDAADRDLFIEGLIDKKIAQEEQLKKEAEAKMLAQMKKNASNQTGKVLFYFDNPQLVSQGKTAFQNYWGDIKDSDYWRVQNKANSILEDAFAVDDQTSDALTDTVKKLNYKDVAYYYDDLLVTPEDFNKSDSLIIEAYYDAGLIYKERLVEYDKAINLFEDLLSNYPVSNKTNATYYQLYRIYTDIGNEGKATFYKNLILTKYPDSEFAKMLIDPDYLLNKQDDLLVAKETYQEAYISYKQKRYLDAVKKCNFAIDSTIENPFLKEYYLLKVMATRELGAVPPYATALKKLIEKYPDESFTPLAEKWLRVVEKDKIVNVDPSTIKNIDYKKDLNERYLFVVHLNDGVNANDLKKELANFNEKFFSSKKLKVVYLPIGKGQNILTSQYLANDDLAKEYFKIFNGSAETESLRLNQVFYISITNYKNMYTEKDIEGYKMFFEKELKIK